MLVTTMNGISVQDHVHNVEANAVHVLLARRALLHSSLEGAVDVLLNLDEVLHDSRLTVLAAANRLQGPRRHPNP